MNKEQKTELVVGAATAIVLLGLGAMMARDVFRDLKASGLTEDAMAKVKALAKDMTDKAAVAAEQVKAKPSHDSLRSAYEESAYEEAAKTWLEGTGQR